VGVLAGFLLFIAKIMTKQTENSTPAHNRYLLVISSEAPLHEKSPLQTAPPTKTFSFEH
jgi:hypothetical protein